MHFVTLEIRTPHKSGTFHLSHISHSVRYTSLITIRCWRHFSRGRCGCPRSRLEFVVSLELRPQLGHIFREQELTREGGKGGQEGQSEKFAWHVHTTHSWICFHPLLIKLATRVQRHSHSPSLPACNSRHNVGYNSQTSIP